jgi:hypothetical protein
VAAFMEASALLGEAAQVLAQGAHNQSLDTLGRAGTVLGQTRELIEQAQAKLATLAHYLDANRNPDYEDHLKHCGFRGSHFILAEYKQHLDRMRQSIMGAEERWPVAAEATRTGTLDEFLRDFSPGVNAAMRIVCRATIDMLEFQHRVAETRYCLLSYHDTSFLKRPPGS